VLRVEGRVTAGVRASSGPSRRWPRTQLASGLDPTPHEFRHSYLTNLRAAGIEDADLAEVAGHTVATMVSLYTHALDRGHAEIRGAIG
jgi:integrase